MSTILNDRSLKKSAENGPEADRSLLLPGPIRHRQRDRCCCQTHSAFENLMNENGSRFLFSKGNTRRAQSVLLLDFLPVRGPVSKEEISKDKCSTWVEISYTLRSFCSHSSPSLRHTNERSVRLDPSKAGRQKATARDRENERVSGDDDFHGLIN